jgi:ATP-dependent helicase/nuclease subunit A
MLRIYKSSAGSGKTFTLVKEYLRLALGKDPYQFRHILAITFTNKAAQEMKERILSTLGDLAHAKTDSPMAATLQQELALEPAELQARATRLLTLLIHHYSDLSVSTIDSFVHRIIRSFAYDLRLPGNFDIEMDGDELLREAVERLMDQVGETGSTLLTRALRDFAYDTLGEGKGWNIEGSLVRFGRELFNEEAYQHITRLAGYTIADFMETRDHLYALKVTFEKDIQAPAADAMRLLAQHGIEPSYLHQGARGIYNYYKNLAEQPATAKTIPNSYVIKTITEGKWDGSKSTPATQLAVQAASPALTDCYLRILAIREAGEGSYLVARALLKNMYSFMLLTEIHRMMEEHKREHSLLHISEFQQKISAIVSEQEAPIIYERIGDRYDSVLIDEFQDTSLLQWRNLLPLIENSQLKMADSLIVGDGKQAIYRFRGGLVEQFAELPKVYGSETSPLLMERENVLVNYGHETLHLNKNYRSRKEIITFNNTLYELLHQSDGFAYRHIYDGHTQEVDERKQGGYVSIDFITLDDLEDDYTTVLHHKTEALLDEARSHGYDWRDIAILTRSNGTGSSIAAYLSARGVPIISPESLLLMHAPEVRRIVSILYYLSGRDQVIRRAELMYYLWPASIGVQVDMTGSYSAFEQRLYSETGIRFDSEHLLRYRLGEMVLQLYALLGLLGSDSAYLQFFADMVNDYAMRHGNKLEDLLDWWETKKHSKSITYPDTMNAVRILTIHKSKGLQFPVVIAPDMDFKVKTSKTYLWTELSDHVAGDIQVFPLPCNKELEQTPYGYLYEQEQHESYLDMVNMLYVATTRPEDRLYIICRAATKAPEDLKTAYAIWHYYLAQQGLWDGNRRYQIGDALTRKASTKSAHAIPEWHYQETQPTAIKNHALKKRKTILPTHD